MDRAWTVGADCREEVGRLQTMDHVFELLPIAGEEYRAGSWTVPDANDIALHVLWAVGRGDKWLVVATMSGGKVCD